MKTEDIFYFTIPPFIFHFKNNKKRIEKSIRQTYFWNKDGLKLFLFREYGPCVYYHPKHVQNRFFCGLSSDPIENLVRNLV